MTEDADKTRYTGPTSLNVPVDWLPLADVGAVSGRCIRVATGGTLTVKTAQGGDDEREMQFLDGETRYVAVTEITDFGDCLGIEVGV